MLTELGCLARRHRLWNALPAHVHWTLITDPSHLIYFANYYCSPFSFNSQSAKAALLLGRDGTALLIADNVQAEAFAKHAFVSAADTPLWYRCVESAGPRSQLLVQSILTRLQSLDTTTLGIETTSCPVAVIDEWRSKNGDRNIVSIDPILHQLRRAKEADEVALIRRCLVVAEAALAAARDQVRPGMSELDIYRLVQRVASEVAESPVIVYGDFVTGPRCETGGGPPSSRTVAANELILLDFSVILHGYRGDFASTFICPGGTPTPRQIELSTLCLSALKTAETLLQPGISCRDIDTAVRNLFRQEKLDPYFQHHTGHGIGLGHPETPYLVPESNDTLAIGDVITLEPGLYLPTLGGMRFERNYLITPLGYETLSHHPLGLL